jgi:diguanylate cyclase (GGDEF)-like protein
LCDCQDSLQSYSEGWQDPEPENPFRAPQAASDGERHAELARPKDQKKKRLYLPLWSETGEKIGSLVGVYRSNPCYRRGQDLQSLSGGFSALGECILAEYGLNDELDAMTDELIGRHEELNLIYDTDDQVNLYQQGRESLQRLVQNCIEYLDVSMATLILPEKNQHFFQYNDAILYSHTLISQPWTAIYPHVREAKTSIVINSISDWSSNDLPAFSPHRIIASPIFEGNNEVCGILLILRNAKAREFVNNDRKLSEVMARKVSKMIQANYDTLTGLLKRNGFEFELHHALSSAQKANEQHCVLFIDLDRIHIVNDIAGHKVGDRLIKQVSILLREQVRESDIVARIGGDEFGLLLKNCAIARGGSIAETLRRKVNKLNFKSKGNRFEVSASVGVTMMTADIRSVKDVMSAAEIASHTAGERGGNNVWSYHHDDIDLARRKKEMHMFNRVNEALRSDRFQLHCQTISSLSAVDQDTHAEILLRMLSENGAPISPGAFLPVAESYFIMPALDRWVVKNSLELLSEYWMTLGGGIWSINLSGQSIGKPDFLQFVMDRLDRAAVPPRNICFEITETATIDNLGRAKAFILALKEYGCKFALDDFGSGLSSFTYLRDLPIDYLKIDGSFVRKILEDPVSAAMVSSVNHIGHIMGLKTIAEYVENELIEDALRSFGIDYAQGYAIAKPEPMREYLERLTADRRASAG